MPEGYTYIRTARAAAKEMDMLSSVDSSAFCAGANGPDVFLYYYAWLPVEKREPNLAELCVLMHTQKTGEFISSLVKHSRSNTEKSYTMGYLAHYFTDCSIHPYSAAISAPGELYHRSNGAAMFEAALESELHKLDYGTRSVPINRCAPKITGASLAAVCMLLHLCIVEVYGLDISVEALADAFLHMRTIRRVFNKTGAFRRFSLRICEPAFGSGGVLLGHVTPAKMKGAKKGGLSHLPTRWSDPFTGKKWQAEVTLLLDDAARRTAGCWFACRAFWKGKKSIEETARFWGANDMNTGLAL